MEGGVESYRANQPVSPVRPRPRGESGIGPPKPEPGEPVMHRPRYGSGLIERPSESMESFAARMDVSVEDLESSIEDGSFRQLLADNGVEARLGILINLQL